MGYDFNRLDRQRAIINLIEVLHTTEGKFTAVAPSEDYNDAIGAVDTFLRNNYPQYERTGAYCFDNGVYYFELKIY